MLPAQMIPNTASPPVFFSTFQPILDVILDGLIPASAVLYQTAQTGQIYMHMTTNWVLLLECPGLRSPKPQGVTQAVQ